MDIYSDNGTNFVEPSKILKCLKESGSHVSVYYGSKTLTWPFNPAGAPQEAYVKRIKSYFKRIEGVLNNYFEEFSYSYLHSRLLYLLADDAGCLDALTSSYFPIIIGGPLLFPPEVQISKILPLITNHWQ